MESTVREPPPLLFVPSFLSSLIRAIYHWDRIVVIIASVCVWIGGCGVGGKVGYRGNGRKE